MKIATVSIPDVVYEALKKRYSKTHYCYPSNRELGGQVLECLVQVLEMEGDLGPDSMPDNVETSSGHAVKDIPEKSEEEKPQMVLKPLELPGNTWRGKETAPWKCLRWLIGDVYPRDTNNVSWDVNSVAIGLESNGEEASRGMRNLHKAGWVVGNSGTYQLSFRAKDWLNNKRNLRKLVTRGMFEEGFFDVEEEQSGV